MKKKRIVKLDEKFIKTAEKFRLESCPNKNCVTCSSDIGSNGAGVCVGVIPDKEDLDYMRLCIFSEDEGTLKGTNLDMTIPELAFIVRAMTAALGVVLTYDVDYTKAFEVMQEIKLKTEREFSKLNKKMTKYEKRIKNLRRIAGLE